MTDLTEAWVLIVRDEEGTDYYGPFQRYELAVEALERAGRAGVDARVEAMWPGRKFAAQNYKPTAGVLSDYR